ncbi:MAG: hypothetical protein Q4B42_06615 [Oscillospiraceae bacterium]|nr:hypothetical protein [Oscillospiraceae bacterium]
MKKRVLLKLAALVLALVMLLGGPALAAETKASDCFADPVATLTRAGGGHIHIEFVARTKMVMDKLGVSKVQIYQTNGLLAATIYYTYPGYGYMVASNTKRHSAVVDYAATAGRSYYAVVDFYAKDDSGGYIQTKTTNTVTA